MLDRLEALFAFSREGSMERAGTALRISQSAVSKRIAALEQQLGEPLIEKQGRQAKLTAEGVRLLQSVSPILAELSSAIRARAEERHAKLSMGVSESVLSSWGASLLASAQKKLPLSLTLHAHRSPVVLDRIRSGEYLLGICAGQSERAPDLEAITLLEEPMVLVPSGKTRIEWKPGASLDVLTIEPRSATWESLSRKAKRLGLQPTKTLESFFAVAQMSRCGLGVGLVPLGVARALGIKSSVLIEGLQRPVSLVARRSTLARPLVQKLQSFLQKEAEKTFTQ
jgi:DNA-binding transcriptional LysR family regulator